MKSILLAWLGAVLGCSATTITVVPIYEPLSLHGTDADGDLDEVGEALRATVMARPMALSGAFPETLVDSIGSPHQVPTNNPNYEVVEANLLVLCRIGIEAELTEDQLLVRLDVSEIRIPEEVDLTSRQVLRLAIIAVRKTLEEYQRPQVFRQKVAVAITGTDETTDSLRDLAVHFTIGE
jgi:hypothetical protein